MPKTMLIDAGWPAPDAGANVILPFLKREGIRHIDWMMASHFHDDHFGGMPEILHSDAVSVGQVLWSALPFDKMKKFEPSEAQVSENIRQQIKEACAGRNVPIREAVRGGVVDLGDGVKCHILAAADPDIETPNYINNNNIVMRLAYGKFSAMFTGDAGFEQEERVMARYQDLTCDVLKIGHHAGAGSTSVAWAQAINAKVGIAPMPKYLSFDERGLRVWRQLIPTGIQIYRTWKHGNIEIQTDGEWFWVLTKK